MQDTITKDIITIVPEYIAGKVIVLLYILIKKELLSI